MKKILLALSLILIVGCGTTITTPSINNSSIPTTSQTSGGSLINSTTTPSDEDIVLYDAKLESNIPEGYYDSCKGLKGLELKNALHSIIKGHNAYSYDKTTSFFPIIDKDPYNEDNIYFIYTGSTSKYTPFQKEHVWAKSFGNFSGVKPMDGDLHNLHPCNGGLNNKRNNSIFAEGGNLITGYPGDNKQGKSAFEPSSFSKGDVARTIFYMATRYDGTDGELDLELTAPQSSNYYDYSSNADGLHGTFEDLYKWATSGLDPVDDHEVSRNNIIYESYQKNRNPFIDHPEFVEMIYDKNYDGPGALLDKNPHKVLSQEEQINEFKNMVSSINENSVDSHDLLLKALEYYNKLSEETKNLVSSTYDSLINKIKVNNQAIDDHYVPIIIDKINELGNVTLEDKIAIEEIERLYELLSSEGKERVSNYQTFITAKETYNNLYEAWSKDNPIEPFAFHFGQVSGMSASSKYIADSTITYENKSFFVSYSYKSGAEFRLGHNKATTAPSKFTSVIPNIKSQSASIESLFDITGQQISIDTYNASGTVNNMYLLKSVDNGETYSLIDTKKALTNERITFDITPGFARYALVVDGSSYPRLGLISLIVS